MAETHAGLDLEPITRMLDASYALIFRTRANDALVDDAACHGVDAGYVTRLREASRERMLPPWLTRLETGSVVDRAAFGSDRQFGMTPFYNHVIRPEGRFHCVIATPHNSQLQRLHLVVGRPRHLPAFDAGSMRLLQRVLPLVNEVLSVKALLADREAAVYGALGISEAWSQPVLVVDRDGTLRYANRLARHFLATCDALVVDAAARLRTTGMLSTERLRDALGAVLRTGVKQTIMLRSPSRSKDACLSIRRVDVARDGEGLPPEWIVITAEDHETGITDENTGELARRHGLTKRETELLSILTRGVHLKDASRQLGMSYNTGRSHLRQIFDKVQVRRQSDLMRLCATGQPFRPS